MDKKYMHWLKIIHLPKHEGDPCICRHSWLHERYKEWLVECRKSITGGVNV